MEMSRFGTVCHCKVSCSF